MELYFAITMMQEILNLIKRNDELSVGELKYMGKELSEMTLEELWELFPIFLVEHTDKWADDYQEVEALLQDLFAGCPVHRISHIGSTAIQGIWAKNIVDVMVEFSQGADMKPVGPEIDEGKEGVLGYYYHYHTYNRKPKGNHAFFLV